MKLRVWILDHDWGDVRNHCLYSSEAAARGGIQAYVRSQWNEGMMDDEEYPGDPDEAVQRYFERFDGDEWYSISNQMVEFPDHPAPGLPDQEVILDSAECAVIVAALGMVPANTVCKEVGMGPQETSDAMDRAYQKLKD